MQKELIEYVKQLARFYIETIYTYQDFFSLEDLKQLIFRALTEDCTSFLSTLDQIYHSEADTRGNLSLLESLKGLNDIYFNNEVVVNDSTKPILDKYGDILGQQDKRFTPAEKGAFSDFIVSEVDKCMAAAPKPENQPSVTPAQPDPWWRYELKLPAAQQIAELPLLHPSVKFRNLFRILPETALGYDRGQFQVHLDHAKALLPGSLFLIKAPILWHSVIITFLKKGIYVKLSNDISQADGVNIAEGMQPGVFLLMNSNHPIEQMIAIAKAIQPYNTLMLDRTMSKDKVQRVAAVLGKRGILKFAKDVPADIVIAGVAALQPDRFFSLGEIPEVAATLKPGTGLTFEQDVSIDHLRTAVALIKPGVFLFNSDEHFDIPEELLITGAQALPPGSGLVTTVIPAKSAETVAGVLSPGTFFELLPISKPLGMEEGEFNSLMRNTIVVFTSSIAPKVIATFSNSTPTGIIYTKAAHLPPRCILFLKNTIPQEVAIHAAKLLRPGVVLFVEKGTLPATLEEIRRSVKLGVQVQAESVEVSALPRYSLFAQLPSTVPTHPQTRKSGKRKDGEESPSDNERRPAP